jgi:DNA-binding response OmpR family regulator
VSQILIVDSALEFASELAVTLEGEGFHAILACDAHAGMRLVREYVPDLLILDLALPNDGGYELLRSLRDDGSDLPVLVLTAVRDERDKLRSYGLGVDEYVTKPIGLRELIARIRAVIRRVRSDAAGATDWIHIGDIGIQPRTHTVLRGGEPIQLRRKEYGLLLALARHRGRILSREALLSVVWGYQPDVVSRTVDTHVLALRRKLEFDALHPQYIMTARTAGYYLQD